MGHTLTRYDKKKRRITLNGIFYAAVSSISFGFSPLFSVYLLASGLNNFDVLSYRWGTAALVLITYSFYKRKSLKISSFSEAWKICLLSALRAITSITLLIGFSNIASGVSTTINFMYPVIVTLTMMIFFGEDKSLINVGAIVLSIIGVYFMSSGEDIQIEGGNTSVGLISSIISAVAYAAYYVLMKQVKADKIEVVKFNTWIMILSTIYFIIAGILVQGKITIVTDGIAWMYILGLGLWATMVSNFTGVKAVRRIGPTLTSILGALQPLTAVILGVIFLDEHLSVKTIIGIILIMIAVGIVVTHHKKAVKK